MGKRLFNIAAIVSMVAFVLVFVVFLSANGTWATLSLSPSFHLTQIDGRILFFNNAAFGPYRGSIIGFAEDPNRPIVSGFDAPGIYYRLIRWPTGFTIWTFAISLLYPLLAFYVLPVLWFALYLRRLRRIRDARLRGVEVITPPAKE